MKNILFFLLFYGFNALSQILQKPSVYELSQLPEWARLMYSEDPDVREVDRLYAEYFKSHNFVKTTYTQQYKHWRRRMTPFIDESGHVRVPNDSIKARLNKQYLEKIEAQKAASRSASMPGVWAPMGAMRVFDQNGSQIAEQANIHCIDECAGSPNIVYCGGETGEVYKSYNGGNSWTCMTMNYDFGYGGIDAIEVNPSNPNIVYAGCYKVWKSTDGGNTWNVIHNVPNYNIHEILVNPTNTQVVLVAADAGLYRSTDGGNSWNQIFSDKCYDVKCNAANANIVYLVKNNPVAIKEEFFISNNMGATWTVQTGGWYNSNDPARTDYGAHIAVTPADPNRIYCYLIGESKPGDNGFIGVYRSNNGGINWANNYLPDGGPYTPNHFDLATSQPAAGYHQIFYNCALMVSKTNADSILVGGINCWASGDGGSTFYPVGGNYGYLDMHVDMQDFRPGANGYWITCDGGIYFSPDFFSLTNPVKTAGLRAQDFWGFGQGWDEDILIGGLYHNGILAWHENYPAGDFMEISGGEPSTGYVHPVKSRETFGNYVGKCTLPATLGNSTINDLWGMVPNENYWPGASSEIQFHPHNYNVSFVGKENKLYRSNDDGAQYNLLYTFGTNTAAPVQYFEISRSNPNVMYVTQAPPAAPTGTLWKTADAGATWTALTIPGGNNSSMFISLSPTDENKLWLAYLNGTNGNKIYKSITGGTSWTNITTSMLDNEQIHSILHYGGTDGGVYCFTDRAVYYRNNTMPNWALYNTGLPLFYNTDRGRPFYRESKVRSGSYGKGIWENTLYEAPLGPVAQISSDKFSALNFCYADTFHFRDYSMLNKNGASWAWTFQGGTPATSTQSNVNVVYSNPGTWLVTLTVTDINNISDTDTMYVNVSQAAMPNVVSEGFEQPAFPPPSWLSVDQLNDFTWGLSPGAGGFGNSAQSSVFDNFDIDSQGSYDDLRFKLNLGGNPSPWLTFDVAYAKFDPGSTDSLKVLVSMNCGQTFSVLYGKGGTNLATAPDDGNYFVPTSAQWRKDSVNLVSVAGQTNVLVALRNVGYWGNNIYLDNVNLNGVPVDIKNTQPEKGQVYLYPNPAQANSRITVYSDKNEDFDLKMFDASGKQVLHKKIENGSLGLPENFPAGTYFYIISSDSVIKRGKLIVSGEKK